MRISVRSTPSAHVQRHQGIHPGRPFAEDARDALTLVDSLPGPADPGAAAEFATARELLRSIVDSTSTAWPGGAASAADRPPRQP
ncbi:hypothetical protein ACWCPQ_12945 [Nocardia sp. NPDC001965]